MFGKLSYVIESIFDFDSDDWTICNAIQRSKSFVGDEMIVSKAGKPDKVLEVTRQAMILALPPRCQSSVDRARSESAFPAPHIDNALHALHSHDPCVGGLPTESGCSDQQVWEPAIRQDSHNAACAIGWELFLRMENHGIAVRNKNSHMAVERRGKRILMRHDIYQEMSKEDDETPQHKVTVGVNGVLRELRIQNCTPPFSRRSTTLKSVFPPSDESPCATALLPDFTSNCSTRLSRHDGECYPTSTLKTEQPSTTKSASNQGRTMSNDMAKCNAPDNIRKTMRSQARKRHRVPLTLSNLWQRAIACGKCPSCVKFAHGFRRRY